MEARNLKEKALSIYTIYNLANTLTVGADTARTAIDYVVAILVNDNAKVVTKVINAHFNEVDASIWRTHLDVLVNFVKYQFDDHVRMAGNCATHNAAYALTGASGVEPKGPITCDACKFPLFVMDELLRMAQQWEASQAQPDGSSTVLQDCRQKFKLYMGHRVRVVRQQDEIAEIRISQQAMCTEATPVSLGLCTIDYKMKQQDKYYREDSIKHFGKRGISWHGAMVSYFEWDVQSSVPKERVLYMDHVVESESKQDWLSVVALVEAVMSEIARLTAVRRVVLLSDNASYYKSPALLLFFPTISRDTGVFISRYIHTEVQDGKSLLDAHFGRCTGQITQFLNKGNDVSTAAEIVCALLDRGGLPNTATCMIQHDRNRLDELATKVERTAAKLAKYFLKVNDVIFYRGDERAHEPSGGAGEQVIDMLPQVSFRCFAYSGVGHGHLFHVNVDTQTVMLAPEDGYDADQLPTGVPDDAEEPDDMPNDDDDIEEIAQPGDADDDTVDGDSGSDAHIDSGQILRLSRSEILTRSETVRRFERIRDGVDITRTRKVRIRCPVLNPTSVAAFAVERASELSISGEGHFRPAREVPGDIYRLASEHMIAGEEFLPGWAKRPRQGKMYGENYVLRFQDEILRMFLAGNRNKGVKKNAAEMLRELELQFPSRFDLPSVSHIHMKINEFSMSQKKPGGAEALLEREALQQTRDDGGITAVVPSTRGRKSIVDDKWFKWAADLVAAKPSITGKPAWEILQQEHPCSPDEPSTSYPTKQWLSATLSRMKAKVGGQRIDR